MAHESKQEITVSQQRPRLEAAPEAPAPKTPSVFSPLEEMERLFDRLMPRSWMRPMGVWNWPLWTTLEDAFEGRRVPQLDVIDHDREVLIRLEVPGVDKKDLHVSVNNRALFISGTVNRERHEEKKDYVRCELSHANFSRSLPLPEGVDATNISATLKDGILEIVLPKEEGAQRRPIPVR